MRRSPIFFIVLAVLAVSYWEFVQYGVAFALTLYVIMLLVRFSRFVRRILVNRSLSQVDGMDGIEFEGYIADVLKQQGYTNIRFTEKYDYGVDIIATKNGVRWGIQVKRYSGLVKADAVRQVVTGLRVYGCDREMVITNSTFSRVAQRLAASNHCILVDRASLNSLNKRPKLS